MSRAVARRLSASEETVAQGMYEGEVWLRKTQDGSVIHKLEGHTGPVERVLFSPDGALLLSGARDGTARLWDSHAGVGLQMIDEYMGSVECIAISPDGQVLATGLESNTAYLWEWKTVQYCTH